MRMEENQPLAPYLLQRLGLSAEFVKTYRVRFFAQADRSIVGSVQLGVLFVMAFWSGQSRQAFAALKQSLLVGDPTGEIELVVVDTDSCPDLYDAPFFPNSLHGYGETAWIRDGVVLQTLGHQPEKYPEAVKNLLGLLSESTSMQSVAWQETLADIFAGYINQQTLEEGAEAMVFVSEDHTQLHARFLDALDRGGNATSAEEALLLPLINTSGYQVTAADSAKALLIELRELYIQRYREATRHS
jgi:hypothetical protein